MKTTASLVTAAALAFIAGCGAPEPSPPTSAMPVAVATDPARTTDVSDSFEAGGVVRAHLTATIASRVMAPVATVDVNAGNRVRRGQTLVTLDARELTANAGRAAAALTEARESVRSSEADVRAAEAALQLARASFDRVKMLYDRRSATAQELDEATSTLTSADARRSSARAHVAGAQAGRTAAEAAQRAADASASYAVLTAPFDGVIAERFVDPGTLASPGMPLLVVEDASSLRLEVQIDEARAAHITRGQEVETLVDASPDVRWCSATVVEMGRLNPASHNFLIKIDVAAAPGLRTGAFGRARFSGPTHRALTVPETSLVHRGQLTFAFVVTADGVARLRAIVAGTTAGGRTEVLAGLADGDRVVSTPPTSLTDGARVKEQR